MRYWVSRPLPRPLVELGETRAIIVVMAAQNNKEPRDRDRHRDARHKATAKHHDIGGHCVRNQSLTFFFQRRPLPSL